MQSSTRLALLTTLLASLVIYYVVFSPRATTGTQAQTFSSERDGADSILAPFEPIEGNYYLGQDASMSSYSGQGDNGLNGLSMEELAAIRQEKVDEAGSLEIYPPDYAMGQGSGRKIYNRIAEYEDWLNPAAYFFTNPYLLVVPTRAYFVNPINLRCGEAEIIYRSGIIEESHSGDSATCWFEEIYRPSGAPGKVWLITVNAADAGFPYAHVDLKQSRNVIPGDRSGHITKVAHRKGYHYHVGQYGVNNLSPRNEDAWVALKERGVETEIFVKLWQQKPASTSDVEDLAYVIRVEGE